MPAATNPNHSPFIGLHRFSRPWNFVQISHSSNAHELASLGALCVYITRGGSPAFSISQHLSGSHKGVIHSERRRESVSSYLGYRCGLHRPTLKLEQPPLAYTGLWPGLVSIFSCGSLDSSSAYSACFSWGRDSLPGGGRLDRLPVATFAMPILPFRTVFAMSCVPFRTVDAAILTPDAAFWATYWYGSASEYEADTAQTRKIAKDSRQPAKTTFTATPLGSNNNSVKDMKNPKILDRVSRPTHRVSKHDSPHD